MSYSTETFKHIKLIKNSKKPIGGRRFSSPENQYINLIPTNAYNTGVLTGKTNQLTVVDIDSYKMNSNIEFKLLFPHYRTQFNTFTVTTPQGGIHLYFQYDDELLNTQLDCHIDIRSNGGYVVAPENYNAENDGYYRITNDVKVKKIPNDLKQFLLKQMPAKPKQSKVVSKKTEIPQVIQSTNSIQVTERDINLILKFLPLHYQDGHLTNYTEFLKFTTAMKELGYKKEWDTYCETQPKYNVTNNLHIWDSIHVGTPASFGTTNEFLNQTIWCNYHRFKPTLENKVEPDKTFCRKKLTLNEKNRFVTVIPKDKSVVIKSDTGTGKTHAACHYLKKNSQKFISIVSRVSLGEEQYHNFEKAGLPCEFYKLTEVDWSTANGYNIIIQLDSVGKLWNVDFSDYVIFLDEFNSIIEYLISSDTLQKYRVSVFKMLQKIISQCRQVICVDADITDLCFHFLNQTTKCPTYVENTQLHNAGRMAYEVTDHKEFIEALKAEEKWLCCCDSLTMAEALKKEMGDESIVLITSETDIYVRFDDHSRIIYSPKIIYGIDSIMERPVFCYYKEHTISPKAFLQQINRCRNITYVKFLFTRKLYDSNHQSYQQIATTLRKDNEFGNQYFKMCDSADTYKKYLELLEIFKYNQVSYNTNKFAHFNHLMEQRGFTMVYGYTHTTIDKEASQTMKDCIKELKYDKFDVNSCSKYQNINKYLCLPADVVNNYKDLFLKYGELQKHYNIIKIQYQFKEGLREKIERKREFNINKLHSADAKICWLTEFKAANGNDDFTKIDSSGIDTAQNAEKLMKSYQAIYNVKQDDLCVGRGKSRKPLDLLNKYDCDKLQAKVYTELFGDKMVSTTRKQTKKKRTQVYTVNPDIVAYHNTIFKYREFY